ncbi:MAG: PilZ domain-containing protein [Deltaproteobacteria bacterium]|nr:PilZ domain-containing protein [Deltaproteobacteria bacterium]
MSAQIPKANQPRLAKRMTCAVSVGDQRFSGVVLNLSQGGLFVQTSAAPQCGASVVLELNPPGDEAAIPLQTEVVWRRVVPQQLRATAQGGMGMKIVRAEENYYSALAGWMRVVVDPGVRVAPETPIESEVVPYRVRVRAPGGPRTRSVSVDAASDEAARRAALSYVGNGWKVIEVEPI